MSNPIDEIRSIRIKKLETLKKKGVDPYPSKISFKITPIKKIRSDFKKLEKSGKPLGLAGRIIAKREHGGSLFFDLRSEGDFQIFMSKDKIGESDFSLFLETVDTGDFVAVWGKPFTTKKKEPTIEATRWEILSKSLLPLPEKWHGLTDVEERFRRRYLDLLMNEEVKGRFEKRSLLIKELRNFLDKEGFLEVETPVLQSLAGGATARPFKTHHNALNIDLYLRIATELHLKELIMGGFSKVFEIGRLFRNEGIDHTHNPEFTTIELYVAYWDHEMLMKFIETLFVFIIKKFPHPTLSFKSPFRRVKFTEALERHAQITDYHRKTLDDMKTYALRFAVSHEQFDSKEKIADKIFAKICRPKFQEPTFVTHYPSDLIPLAKRSPENPAEALAIQLVAGGVEVAKMFNELNDPLDQKERFKKEKTFAEKGDKEAQPMDEDFIEAKIGRAHV